MNIFVEDPKIVEMGNELKYHFYGRQMEIYWRNNLEVILSVEKGDIVNILLKDNRPEIREVSLPKKRNDLILWLLQIPEEYMAASQSSFERMYKCRQEEYSSRVTTDIVFSNHPNYAFAYYKRLGDDDLYPIAGYCKRISKNSLKEILTDIVRKDAILNKILSSEIYRGILKFRFKFTDGEIEEMF
jgi:hypothetical protein